MEYSFRWSVGTELLIFIYALLCFYILFWVAAFNLSDMILAYDDHCSWLMRCRGGEHQCAIRGKRAFGAGSDRSIPGTGYSRGANDGVPMTRSSHPGKFGALPCANPHAAQSRKWSRAGVTPVQWGSTLDDDEEAGERDLVGWETELRQTISSVGSPLHDLHLIVSTLVQFRLISPGDSRLSWFLPAESDSVRYCHAFRTAVTLRLADSPLCA